MMNTNASSDLDDFDTVPGIQPSGQLLASDVPGLSQDDLYDWEYEDDDQMGGGGVVAKNQNSGPSNHALYANRPLHQTITAQAQAAGAGRQAATPSFPGRLLSWRALLILLVLVAVPSGVIFAATRGQAAPGGNRVSTVPQTIPTMAPTHLAASPTPRKPVATPVTKKTTPTATATPASATPTPKPTLVPQGPALPQEWTASGRGVADANEAIAVAETFTQRYETIDFRSRGTLSAAQFILTNAANARFTAHDKRATDAFALQIQQQQLIQVGVISGGQIVKAQNQNGRFFAWVSVSYQLVIQQGQGNPTTAMNLQMNVLLVAAPFGSPADAPPMGGIGWLVSSYQPGNMLTLPPIPAQP